MVKFTVVVQIHCEENEAYLKKSFNYPIIPRVGEDLCFDSDPSILNVSLVYHYLEKGIIEVYCELLDESWALDLFIQGGWEYESSRIGHYKIEDEYAFNQAVENRKKELVK